MRKQSDNRDREYKFEYHGDVDLLVSSCGPERIRRLRLGRITTAVPSDARLAEPARTPVGYRV